MGSLLPAAAKGRNTYSVSMLSSRRCELYTSKHPGLPKLWLNRGKAAPGAGGRWAPPGSEPGTPGGRIDTGHRHRIKHLHLTRDREQDTPNSMYASPRFVTDSAEVIS